MPTPTPTVGESIAINGAGKAPFYALSPTPLSVVGGTVGNGTGSVLTNAGSGYSPKDIVAFSYAGPPGDVQGGTNAGGGTTTGQELAIVVDTVSGGGSTGPIASWHILWGGQYSTVVNHVMTQDGSGCGSGQHSCTSGTGAQLIPVWSGFMALDTRSGKTTTLAVGGAGSGYHVGDTITLQGDGTEQSNEGQLVQVVVDAVDNTCGTGCGGIAKGTSGNSLNKPLVHFMNYGSYSALPSTQAAWTQASCTGNGGGSCSGTGASFNIAWTWGALATTISAVNTPAAVNTTGTLTNNSVTLSGLGTTMGVQVGMAVVDTDNANYIQSGTVVTAIAGLTVTMSKVATAGSTDHVTFSGATISLTTSPSNLNDTPALPSLYNQAVTLWYYGHDDGAAINNALVNSPSGVDVTVPGASGSSVEIVLPNGAANPILKGIAGLASGIYAFAPAPQTGSTLTMMNHLIFRSTNGGTSGGLENLEIEGMFLPQGTGSGYDSTDMTPSTTGSVVELDGGKAVKLNYLFVEDAMGSGNAEVQIGKGSGYPSGSTFLGSIGDFWFTNSRMDVNGNIAGPNNPDYALNVEDDGHDSFFTNMVAFDAAYADVSIAHGNHLVAPHINSTVYPNTPSSGETYSNPTVFSGVATFGILIQTHSTVTDLQCDNANEACVFVANPPSQVANDPTNIIGVAMKCGPAQSVPPNYWGVEFADGASHTNVTGLVQSSSCGIPNSQLIHLDGVLDPTAQIFGNAGATFTQLSLPTVPGTANGQVYFSEVSSTQVELCPYGGNGLTINGVLAQIPVSCVFLPNTATTGTSVNNFVYATSNVQTVTAVANHAGVIKLTLNSTTGLVNGDTVTVTGVYATTGANGTWPITNLSGNTFDLVGSTYSHSSSSGGTVTYVGLQAGTGGHSTLNGVEVNATDHTQTLVGMVYMDATQKFNDTLTVRDVASWYNRQQKKCFNTFTADRTTTSPNYSELNSEIECEFVAWGSPATPGPAIPNVDWSITSSVSSSIASGGSRTTAYFGNGTVASGTCATIVNPEPEIASMVSSSSSNQFPIGLSGSKTGLTEDVHCVTLVGKETGSSTATWIGSSSLTLLQVNPWQ